MREDKFCNEINNTSITMLLAVLLSMVGVKTFAHDIEAKNLDGVTIYYNWINNKI